MHPTQYIMGMAGIELLGLAPYMLLTSKNRALCAGACRTKKVYITIIGVGAIGTYLIILYALTVAKASFVSALRECSVVFGAVLGVALLKEDLTLGVPVGIAGVAAGLVMIKLAA